MQVPNHGAFFFSPTNIWIFNILLWDYQKLMKANLYTVVEGKCFFYPEQNTKCWVER